MSYIGNQVTSVPHVIDTFSGNGITSSFGPMVRSPAGTAAIAVFVSGTYRTPGIDYTLNGSTIIFSTPPTAGVNNIVVHHLGNGVMATQVPADGSVTGNKIAVNAVRGNNIVAGTITGNLIADGAVSGNNIVANAIRGNNIVAGTISGNLISENAISANQFSASANSKIIGSGLVSSIIFGG